MINYTQNEYDFKITDKHAQRLGLHQLEHVVGSPLNAEFRFQREYLDNNFNMCNLKSTCYLCFSFRSQMNDYPIAFYGDWNHPFGEKDNGKLIICLEYVDGSYR